MFKILNKTVVMKLLMAEYGRPNGAKFKNSNSITFKDNDHIQRSHSHSRHEN